MLNEEKQQNFNVLVCDGEITSTVINAVNSLAPYSKIVIFFEENCEFSLEFQLFEKLKKAGCKVVLIEIEKDKILSADSVCGLFNLHEDVRLVISLGQTHEWAKYFATIRNLPTIFLENQISCQLFANAFYLFNGNLIDKFFCDVKKIFVFDKPNVQNKQTLVEFIFNAKISLFNSYLKMLFCQENYNANEYLEILTFLDDAEKIINENDELTTQKLTKFFYLICKAFGQDEFLSEKVFCFSHVSVLEILLNEKLTNQHQFYLNAWALSNLKSAEKEKKVEIINYNDLVQEICKLYKLDFSLVLKNVTQNLDYVNRISKEKIGYLESALSKMQKYFLAFKKRYVTQGGTIKKARAKERKTTKHCAYALNFNLSTLITELPFIKTKNI